MKQYEREESNFKVADGADEVMKGCGLLTLIWIVICLIGLGILTYIYKLNP